MNYEQKWNNEQAVAENLGKALDMAEKKLNDLIHHESAKKNKKFDSLSSAEQTEKIDALSKKSAHETDAFEAAILEERMDHAQEVLAENYAKKQQGKSVQELREECQRLNECWQRHKDQYDSLSALVKNDPKHAQRTEEERELERFKQNLEATKQDKLINLIQQKTFTHEYQAQLQKIKQELEYRGVLTPTEKKRLDAINKTLANNGTVSELDTIKNPAEVFVGNEFEKQLYQESLNTLTLAADLNATAANNPQVGALAQQAENNSQWAMAILQDNQNPALAGAVTEIAAGFIKQAQALSIAQQHPETNTTAAPNSKISENDIAHFAEKAADATGEFSKGFALGAWQGEGVEAFLVELFFKLIADKHFCWIFDGV